MTIIQLFNLFIASLSKPEKLTEAAHLKKGKMFLYLLFIALITAIPIGIQTYQTLASLNRDGEAIVAKLPDFKVTDGSFTSTEPIQPFTNKSDSLIFIFNPEHGETEDKDTLSSRIIGIGFLKEGLYFVTPFQELSFTYKDLDGLDNQSVKSFLTTIQGLNVFSLLIAFLILLISAIIQVFITNLLYTIFANLVTAFTRRRLPFSQVWNMTLVASTLPTLFFTLTQVAGLSINFQTEATLFVTVYLYYLALRTLPKPE